MDRLEFENYEEFVCDVADTFDSLEDEFDAISIIAKYDEVKEIIKALLDVGYDLCNISLEIPNWGGYDDEYILTLSCEGVWCERFKRDTGYFNDESNVIYIMDNCSSKVIPYCKSKNVYEVSVGESDDFENEELEIGHSYTINGKSVDKETFDEYVSKFAPDLVSNKKETSDDDSYSISIKCNLDADEAMEIIKNMEHKTERIYDMFREMHCFSRLLI